MDSSYFTDLKGNESYMAKITLHSDRETTVTSVSNVFIDEYMSNANGEFVKIYLYLLRCMNSSDATFSISAMADKFEHTEKDIKRALNYWERMHLLRLEYDSEKNLTGVCFVDSNESSESESMESSSSVDMEEDAVLEKVPATPALSISNRKQYSADEIMVFQKNDDVAELIFIMEKYLGRPLTSTDTNALLYWFDELGFSTDLIEYLVEYCVTKGHMSVRYMDKVALAWAESKVKTVEDAKKSTNLHSELYFAVLKAFGISGRNLVAAESGYIDKWKNTYGFSSELILEGCRRTMQAIHQPSFEYTDSILSSWRKNNISTLEDVQRSDEAFQKKKSASATRQASTENGASKNKFNNFTQRSYNYDELEKMLLTTNVH